MDVYGLIGFPLTHSFSSKFFNNKFETENIEAEYLNFEIKDVLEIKHLVLLNQHLKGLNVTIPYKEKVIPFLNELSLEAEAIGAVNVVNVERKPEDTYFYKLTGYNTDYIGFKNSIAPLLNNSVDNKALILGTGGASKAVAYALNELNIEWQYVSRSRKYGCITYEDLTADVMNKYNIIVNTTPLGTFPNIDTSPDIPYNMLTPNHILYDLVYNPDTTLFMKRGMDYGAVVKNGREMLELQAIAAWNIWTNKDY